MIEAQQSPQSVRESVRALFGKIRPRAGWASPKYPLAEWRSYRGRRRFVVGYSHSRTYSHYASGLVYDRVIGYGDSPAAALAMMEAKLDGREAAHPQGDK